MGFKKWFKDNEDDLDLYNFPEEAMEAAWNAALEKGEAVVAEKYDEQEPWLKPGEITEIINSID